MALRSASHISFDNYAQAEQWLRANGFDAENFLNQVANESAYSSQARGQYREPTPIPQLSRSATYGVGGQLRASGVSSKVEQLLSNVEQILRNSKKTAKFPNAKPQVQANQYSGVRLNEDDEQKFKDSNPDVLRKREETIKYQKEIAPRHLRPTTPPQGILVVRERRAQLPPPPPVGKSAQAPVPEQPASILIEKWQNGYKRLPRKVFFKKIHSFVVSIL
jgi:hypothetical protein